ncbi:putative polyketide synthase [Hypoxylon sp. FL1857]|nr:putative polyketide synthase [Hypoxylon sp. FL1857]
MTKTFHQNLGTFPAVLLFGSLALSFDAAAFHQLRKTATRTESLAWLLNTLSNLADDCEVVFAAVPTLKQARIREHLLDVRDALATGRSLRAVGHLPNTVLIPLVVATHLTQYVALLEHGGLTHEEYVAKKDGETLGLCTGLLAAFAVARSHNQADLEKYGAAAVRLGMLAGLAVDLRDTLSPSKSLSVGWGSSEMHDALVRTLKDVPEAYVSVEYDENRATVTAAASAIPQLQSKLRAFGLTTSEISLYGRFHSLDNSEILEHLLSHCDKHVEFQLPDASSTAIPTRSGDANGEYITQGALHTHALRAILVDSPKWYKILAASWAEKDDNAVLLSFGTERCVPPSILRKVGARLVHLADSTMEGAVSLKEQEEQSYSERPWRDSDIAVVGMACKLPGANDVTEFWDLLASAKPQHQEIGTNHPRFDFSDTPTRSADDPGMRRRWFANLVSGADQFDHRFFKKSPRESASMDPAQRLLLQVAYQAVEQSGHLNRDGTSDVGVFLGTTGNDYQANAASQAANAFTTTGNLLGFLAGKVSHNFGWTGPAMVVDTACSGSLVAIHQACNAIASGECSAALAGGAHIMTQPAWFQNLAGGQFLSPTGQCKPFDAAADGYCRSEGVGAVFLKRMDRAVADGDSILGVIAATAVQQNQNCTPIFVPNVPSLGDLFRTVTTKAHVKPSQISVVEAHGTGTPVGDPAEYASIKSVLGGANRTSEKPLIIGSVKGLVGHLEGTSGVVALIKLLLMLHVGLVPPQASFKTINPAIGAQPADNMTIATKVQPWNAGFRLALINNYGASGSNASMVLAQAPTLCATQAITMPTGVKYPFWLSAHDSDSLRRRAKALRNYLGRVRGRHSLANLSYNVARQNNRALDQRVFLSVTSLDDLDQKLSALDKGETQPTDNKTVVLCFGGQISTFIGLDRQVYENTALLKKHVDRVDAVARSLGVASIFPSIFERTPIQDTVLLQVALFALQYACAQSWIDSGIKPAAVVGHSFGELTALCISQALSLEDTVKMIVNRATLVRDAWGPDKGSMMAVSEVDLADVQKLLLEANSKHQDRPAGVACYNGPRSFTLAGPTVAIDAVADTLANSSFTGIKSKRLNVSNAFHCALVDDLTDKLEQSAQGLTFREPVIPMERATESPISTGKLSPKFVADHMRSPVYFYYALKRLATKHAASSLVFLEAGSNSTITHMASRALASDNLKNAHFQAVNITNCDDGWNKLVDTTLALWRAGLPIHHWAHHPLQARASTELSPLLLPPYQFDPDSRHWINLKIPPKYAPALPASSAELPSSVTKKPEDEGLVIFAGYQDGSAQRVARFRINTSSPEFKKLFAGHMTIQTAPICPATVQIGFLVEGLASIRPAYKQDGRTPQFQDIQYQSPVCASSSLATWIEASEEGSEGTWRFEVFSTEIKAAANKESKMLHTTGRVIFMHPNDASLQRELAYFPRLFGHGRATDLLTRPDVDEVLAQRNIYRVFAEIVDYGDEYRGLRKVVGRGNEAAGVVVSTNATKGHKMTDALRFNPHLSDAFCQVAGIWANFLTHRAPTDAYLANGIGQWIRAPAKDTTPAELHVFSTTHRSSDKVLLSDVFVFDAADGSLLEVMLGIAYVQIPKSAMSKLLRRLSDPQWLSSNTVISGVSEALKSPSFNPVPVPVPQQPTIEVSPPTQQAVKAPPKTSGANDDILERVKAIIADLSGLETHEIKANSELADLGIDSLVGMELINELEAAFSVKLPESEIQAVTDMPGLMKCMLSTLGADSDISDGEDSGASTPNNGFENTGYTTPASLPDIELEDCAAKFPFDAVMGAFNEVKAQTDERIAQVGQTRYVAEALPLQDELTVALTLEAFEEVGAGIRAAQPGQRLARISHGAEHRQLVTYLYRMLETLTQIIKMDGDDIITRTAVPLPSRSSRAIYEELETRFPDQQTADKLTYYAGTNLARVLSGATDGVKLIFGSAKGRELAAGLYGDWPLNRATYAGVEDFLTRLVARLEASGADISPENPIRILEMGAGTGGTTKRLVPLLAKLGAPVEYTFTDLSPSLVAQARKAWAKQYPFMRFAAHDMEKPPSPELVGTQHLVIASNAVHATHSLQHTTSCIHRMLRPDGFLCLVEMTRPMYWVDIVFGLFEGWWMYDDGRKHVIADEKRWESELQASGYGHVNWIDGASEESKIWKFIIAAADSETRYERVPIPPQSALATCWRKGVTPDCENREQVVAGYIAELTADWDKSLLTSNSHPHYTYTKPQGKCVLITGATGGLGSHLVAKALARTGVTRVVCLNRRNNKQDARERQKQSLLQKGTGVSPDDVMDRIDVIETDLSKPNLGLSEEAYDSLCGSVTHIVHNAWLMHSKWPVKRFEPQLRIMANMIGLARDISTRRGSDTPVTFEFVSSIATVGHHPLWTGRPVVPEERVPIESVLPTGYGDAKYICERLLDATLHHYPSRFRVAAVRLGQIAGSSLNGYWNHAEHVFFLIKSSQTLGALPDFDGSLGWTPVDAIADTLVDILLQPPAVPLHPIYHIENPVRQPWRAMIATLADALHVPAVIPFAEWVRRVRQWPVKADNGADGANPAFLLTDFLDDNFTRMSCGGLLMGTANAREHSPTLARVGAVSDETTRLFVAKWREAGLLK